MNRKIREILNRIAEANDISFEELKVELENGVITEEVFWNQLGEISYSIFLKAWANENDYYILSNISHLPYINPGILMKRLNKIEISAKDLFQFVNWYIKEFVSFYKEKANKDLFMDETTRFLEEVDKVLKKYCISKTNKFLYAFLLYKNNRDAEFLDAKYTFLFDIANGMLKQQELGISYTEQYDFLNLLGLNQALQEKLLYANIQKLEKGAILKEEKKKKIDKRQVCIVTPKKNSGTLEKTTMEKMENERRHQLFGQLSQYYDINSSLNKRIIEGEILEEVLKILNELYSTEEITQIKVRIFENNKMIKQKLFLEAKDELLEDKNRDTYELLMTLLYSEKGEWKMYSSIIKNAILEVDNLLYEYIGLSFADKENLKEDYKEQLDLVFKTLEEYGLTTQFIMDDCFFYDGNARK